MDDKAIKKHEQRGYSRGYSAGMRRREHEAAQLQRQLDNNYSAKYERVFLSVLNGLISTDKIWEQGEKKFNTAERYCELADTFARSAMRYLKN